MKKKTVFFTHASALSSLFILGNAIITAPVATADEFTFLGFITAAAVSFSLYLVALPLAQLLFSEQKHRNLLSKIGVCLIFIAVALFSLWCLADTFLDFANFVSEVILTETPKTLIIIVFAVVCLYFALRRQEDILKFCLIAFWIVLILTVFFFLATMHNYNLRNIFIFRLPEIKNLYSQTKPYLINPVLPSLLLPVYNVLVFKKARKGAAFSGLAIGSALLGICVLGAVLLFTPHLAGQLHYPYSSAISTVTVGRLFTRMDGFSYFIYFSCALTKITVCIFIMFSCLKKIKNMCEKTAQTS